MASQDTKPRELAGSSGTQPPFSLPPRPRHTFSMRTVERLQQQKLASAGAYVGPEQIPAYVQRMRNNLSRVESALSYRATHEGGDGQTHLSKFERIRVGQILADAVLDIVTVSIASSNETYDAVVRPHTTLSLATPRADATPSFACDAEGHEHSTSQTDPPTGEPEAERAPQSASFSCLEAPSLASTPLVEGQRDSQGGQPPLSFNDSSLSLRFKPVLSMYSGAESSNAGTPQGHGLCRPRKYYDIDLQRLGEFTRCLRLIQRMRFTDSEFEMLGLRYAIPGIRELDRSEEVFFALSKQTEALARMGECDGSFLCEEGFSTMRPVSLVSTGGGTHAETPVDNNTDTYSDQHNMTVWEKKIRCSPNSGDETWVNETSASSMQQPYKDHCLPLFRGGKNKIVQSKDMNTFLAMVDMRLQQIDHELGGRLNNARADLASSSAE